MSFFSKTPFFKIEESSKQKLFLYAKQKLKLHGVELFGYELRRMNGYRTALTIVSGINFKQPFGLIVGAATRTSVCEAIEHATAEVYRNAVAFIVAPDQQKCISYKEFCKLKKVTPDDHDSLALHHEYYKMFFGSFDESGASGSNHIELLDEDKLIVNDLPYIFPELNEAPVVCMRAMCSDLIQLKYGGHAVNQVERGRLARFLGVSSVSNIDLNTLPHPFG